VGDNPPLAATNTSIQHAEHDKPGEANIETPLFSKLNDRFVLHDSKGFEAGEEYNLSNVKTFIERRKTHGDVKEQLHAVWWANCQSYLYFPNGYDIVGCLSRYLLRVLASGTWRLEWKSSYKTRTTYSEIVSVHSIGLPVNGSS